MNELTHASFFSGVGGLDLGLERAGWRTVSFSEIDPYASAVLAQRWPGVPNLGDVIRLHGRDEDGGEPLADAEGGEWYRATLWSGGFPCQDLSVAGKRRGMVDGTRSGLAYAFLDLVGRHRPRFILLENVPGLLSSHGGRDMAALLGAMVELGYGVGYRTLDARYFGVPQRRRRVFILGVSPGGRAGAECAAEVLSVGSRCDRHPETGGQAGPNAADGVGAGIARSLSTSQQRIDSETESFIVRNGYLDDELAPPLTVGGRAQGAEDSVDNTPWFLGPSSDAAGMRAPHGVAGRLDDRGGVVQSLDTKRGGPDDNEAQAGHLVPVFGKRHRASSVSDHETWAEAEVSSTLNGMDGDYTTLPLASVGSDNPLLPLGLDSHRYRCCGNGVVSDVAEFIGLRLAVIA